jgi:hypothetical protein
LKPSVCPLTVENSSHPSADLKPLLVLLLLLFYTNSNVTMRRVTIMKKLYFIGVITLYHLKAQNMFSSRALFNIPSEPEATTMKYSDV